jgi:aspartyl-tRNA synthetase
MHPFRTHNCGELRIEDASKEARLSGWIYRKRDHGSLLFIDLRDHFGVTQVVIQPDREFFDLCQRLKLESVITVSGKVEPRSSDTVNPELPTGEIELLAEDLVVRNEADTVPIYLAGEEEGPEDLRLRYRYLDLRRRKMHSNILLRSQVISEIRKRMTENHGFSEIQTPILTSSSPEGARDYLVPSRVHPGRFYALPQSPQQFKQLLMAGGFDRYFQIAPCFRDEDARADRSPGEHYQLDMEMAFVTQEDIFYVVESVLHGVFSDVSEKAVTDVPFPRIQYNDSMRRYGTDKPDLRIPLEISDCTDIFRNSEFRAFRKVIEEGGVVRALTVNRLAGKPRSFFDKLVEYAQGIGSKGLAYLVWQGGASEKSGDELKSAVKGPIVKFLSPDELGSIASTEEVEEGCVTFFVADKAREANRIAGDIRLKLGNELDMVEKDVFKFCWIVDYPMYEYDEESGQVIFSHNPFSMPQGGLETLESSDPLSVLAYQYDIVCNGCELGSGAIRNHRPDIIYKAFEIAGYAEHEVDEKFGALSAAFRYGTPPHGGIAPGIDRMVMMLAEEDNIREVIAFPMNQRAQDLMMNAPGPVSRKQLRDLHIDVKMPKKEADAITGDA